MLTKLLFVSFLSLSKGWPFGVGADFDPDVDLCNDLNLSGGVVTDDGKTYIFKGKYFWRTLPMFKGSKIVGFANLISDKWPEITDNIGLAFTVYQNDSLMTVFVVKNQWFGYQNESKVMEGTVDLWPDFKKFKSTMAFTTHFRGSLVFVLHSNNNNYILYDFKDMSEPTKVRDGRTTVRANYLLFTEDSSASMPGAYIRTLIDVRAGLTYKDKLFLLSKEYYCVIDISAQSFERECIPGDINPFLGCPLDISVRPTTTTTITTVMTTSSENTSESLDIRTTFPKRKTTTTREPIYTEENEEVVRTGVPILGRTLEEEEFSAENTPAPALAPALQDVFFEKRQNSEKYVIIVLVVAIVVVICSLLMIGMTARITKSKRTEGEVIYTD